jgi:hypothetical protein
MAGTSDTNWRSFVGPQDNGKLVTSEDWQAPSDPKQWDDLFKCSNVENLTATGLTIPASREDSIDCVRGSDYSFQSCTIEGSVTIKGAIDGVKIYNCVISGTVELGQYDNYWKFGRAPTTAVLLHTCTSPDGKPIRVKVWDADTPYVVNTNVKITKIPKFIWLPYFIFRRLTNPKKV